VKTAWATLIAFLMFCDGCVTRPDWIQATLVTADVTDVWRGAVSGGAGLPTGRMATFELLQQGPKVQGGSRSAGAPTGLELSKAA
jgi:hypothetical protein